MCCVMSAGSPSGSTCASERSKTFLGPETLQGIIRGKETLARTSHAKSASVRLPVLLFRSFGPATSPLGPLIWDAFALCGGCYSPNAKSEIEERSDSCHLSLFPLFGLFSHENAPNAICVLHNNKAQQQERIIVERAKALPPHTVLCVHLKMCA